MNVPNNRVSNYMRQKLTELQGEIGEFTIRVRDTDTPFSEIDRSSSQKISKHVVELNSMISEKGIIDIYQHCIQK